MSENNNLTNIAIAGIGGAGGNIISYIYNKQIKDVELIAINTDEQVLFYTKAHKRLQIGEVLTHGLGAGMRPSIGKEAALESYKDIKSALQGMDMLFLFTGLGGGTGSGATPVVAKIAREMGILVVSTVTKPFCFEGKKRASIADSELMELKKHTDSLMIIPNDNLLTKIDRSLSLKESFQVIDETISELITNISEALYSNAQTDINLSFEDLQFVFGYKGISAIGVSEKIGVNAVNEAMQEAIKFSLFDNVNISDAMCVLIIFKIHPDYSYLNIKQLKDSVDINEDISVIFATEINFSLPSDYAKATVIATGFERMLNLAMNNV